MDHRLFAESSYAGPQEVDIAEHRAEALHCSICQRRLGMSLFFLEETGDVPEPRQSWALCEACNEAVHEQMAHSSVRTPVRLRVAVGIVATERTPEARRGRLGELSDAGWAKLFFWLFPITMLIHLAVIVAVAGWFR